MATPPELHPTHLTPGVRLVVYGAGAIGGLTGALLSESGHDVMLIARGKHAQAIERNGLTVESADGPRTVKMPVITNPEDAGIRSGDIVLLAVKSQQTQDVLERLRGVAPKETPIVCLQNGVANERAALRLFPNVYGVCVMCPATHVEPGVVQQNSAPTPGLLDLGRFPRGKDEVTAVVSAAFRSAGFDSLERNEVLPWKYRKLLTNLGNAAHALLKPGDADRVVREATKEGEKCLHAAGIEAVSPEADQRRRAGRLTITPIPGKECQAGSTLQSLRRRTGSIETDYLNGEIVLLGRITGVPTPVNDLLSRLAWVAAAQREEPQSVAYADFERMLT